MSKTAMACRRLRRHPITISYLLSCAMFAAAVAGSVASLAVLGVILSTEVAIVSHVVHAYGPKTRDRPSREDQQHD